MNIPLPEYTPALLVAIPLLGAFLTPLLSKINEKVRNIFVLAILGLIVYYVSILSYTIFTKSTAEQSYVKTYIFGAQDITLPLVRIVFTVDALSMVMAIIASVLLLVVVIYSWSFMKEYSGLDKYYTLLLLLTAGILGMILTGDLFNLFVFIEITSIASAALVAFWVDKGESIEAGFKYILISTIGALFVLFAVALLYGQYNALNIAVLSNAIQYTFIDKIALILFIVALAMKAGLAPMHMWLPDSYSRAPSSVTLALVAATLVSLYAVLRMIFTLYGNALLEFAKIDLPVHVFIGWLLIPLAIASIIIGVMMALRQTDFKRLIGFAAVAEIGYIFLAIGTGLAALGTAFGRTALEGGIFHILNDALDVGLLFLVAGAIYYSTKEWSLDSLGGLARNMKYTTIFFVIGLLAVSGMPPFNGFSSKLLIYQSTFQLNPILAIVAILCSILLLAAFVKVFYSAFMGPKLPQFEKVKEVPKTMLCGMFILSVLIIFIGLFPGIVVDNIIQPAVAALLDNAPYLSAVLGGV
ncbi:MAG: proton-conducting transporter membrane subunit [Thermoplasmatota archaeon]